MHFHKAAAQRHPVPPEVFFTTTQNPAVMTEEFEASREIAAIQSEDWRSPIVALLEERHVPEGSVESQHLQQRSRNYQLIGGTLYKAGVTAPLLRCVSRTEGQELLDAMHRGACGAHASSRALVGRAFRQGFYWPTALRDAQELVRRCEACQRASKMSRLPATVLQQIAPVWPLARWGMDIIGHLPTAPGSFRYAIVAVEYFSKWLEAETMTAITSANIVKFLWKNIICRFGVSRELTVDNGRQFDCDRFVSYCNDMGTKVCFASVYHPQSNGACERANESILTALGKRIFDQPKGTWTGELPGILWALRTSETRPIGFTPFKLLFGEEAMTPEEAALRSLRVIEASDPEMESTVKDLAEETRLAAVENLERYQKETAVWRNKRIKIREFREGQLVLRRRRNADTLGKFESKWEGPYVITSSRHPGSYRLMTPDGEEDPHTWNADRLIRYFP
ncbi:unnamed protein product [Urochloa humidicola]